MATKPAGKKFRSGSLGDLATDVYSEINAINAGAASWDSIVTSAAAADSAIDFNDQQLTGVSDAGGLGQTVKANSDAVADLSLGQDAIADIADPGAATATDAANKINAVLAALRAAGIIAE